MKPNILSVQQCEALTVVQLNTHPNNTFEYITLAKAMKLSLLEVTEVSLSGSVNEIYVINKSRHFVFMTDGDILAGAKQNRVLNTSVLLAPKTKTILPVSCVEQGRWNYSSEKFSPTDYVIPMNMRAAKSVKVGSSMKSSSSFRADQSEVWNKVSEYSNSLGVSSRSKNLSDVFEQRESAYDKFLKNFQLHPNANCISFFIQNELKSVDVFNRTDVFEEYFPKMIKGASLDVYGKKAKGKLTEAEASYKTLDLLDRLEVVSPDIHKGVSAGDEKRFSTHDLTGFELNYNGHLIHLSAHTISNNVTGKANNNSGDITFI